MTLEAQQEFPRKCCQLSREEGSCILCSSSPQPLLSRWAQAAPKGFSWAAAASSAPASPWLAEASDQQDEASWWWWGSGPQLALLEVGEATAPQRSKTSSGDWCHLQENEIVLAEVLCSEVSNSPQGFPPLSYRSVLVQRLCHRLSPWNGQSRALYPLREAARTQPLFYREELAPFSAEIMPPSTHRDNNSSWVFPALSEGCCQRQVLNCFPHWWLPASIRGGGSKLASSQCLLALSSTGHSLCFQRKAQV